MSLEQHNTNLSISVLVSILALIAGFIWDRIHIEAVDQRAFDHIELVEKQNQELREELMRVKDRQRVNEDRIMTMEDTLKQSDKAAEFERSRKAREDEQRRTHTGGFR